MDDLNFKQSFYLQMLVKWSMLNMIQDDLAAKYEIDESEIDSVKFALQAVAHQAGLQVMKLCH
jgi:hypothetical protein